MLTSTVKRFILPFSTEKYREPFSSEIEAAVVFVHVEDQRGKGGGLIFKQSEEILAGLTKIGYPVWMFPKQGIVYIFDGYNDASHHVFFTEMPSAKAFMDILEANYSPREKYTAFLSNYSSYFQQSAKQKEVSIKGLIADWALKEELTFYRKEGKDISGQTLTNLTLLAPTMEETAISKLLSELDSLQSALKEDTDKLSDCLRLLNKTTGQYITEIDYQAQAVKEEADAKIRAQEEILKPQIAKLNSQYKHHIKEINDNTNREIDNLEKQKSKTQRSVAASEEKIKHYQQEAKAHAAKKHRIYEKRLKEKINHAQKEVSGLKKELKRIEQRIKDTSKRRIQETSKLTAQRDEEVKMLRQPLLDLEASRDEKMQIFRQETEKLLKQEKPIVESINKSIKLRGEINLIFEELGIKDQSLKTPSLFYIPFYVACYQSNQTRRYLVIPPSKITTIDLSSKFKGALGISKIKNLLTPRFETITNLIEKNAICRNETSSIEGQLGVLCEKNNLLRDSTFDGKIQKGLFYLNRGGWLSDKEYQHLSENFG